MPTETTTMSTHILRVAGITVTGTFDEKTAAWTCEWSAPVAPSKRRKVLRAYSRWRDGIFATFARRTGKRIAVIEVR